MLSRSPPTQCGRHPTQDSIGYTPLLLRTAPAMLYPRSWTSLLFWYLKVSVHHFLHTLWVYSMHACIFSHVQLFATPYTIVHQAPLSLGLFRQNSWECCHFLLQGILSTQGSSPHLLHLLYQQNSSPRCHLGSPLLQEVRSEFYSMMPNKKLA